MHAATHFLSSILCWSLISSVISLQATIWIHCSWCSQWVTHKEMQKWPENGSTDLICWHFCTNISHIRFIFYANDISVCTTAVLQRAINTFAKRMIKVFDQSLFTEDYLRFDINASCKSLFNHDNDIAWQSMTK